MIQSEIGDLFLVIIIIAFCFVLATCEIFDFKLSKLWKAINNILKEISRVWKQTEKNTKDIEEIKRVNHKD